MTSKRPAPPRPTGFPKEAVPFLSCPRCSRPFALEGATLRCLAGHAFDVARQGYVNLNLGHERARLADTAAMVAARARFLEAGHYDVLSDRLAAIVAGHAPFGRKRCLVEIGAGTGYHLAHVLRAVEGVPGLAVDLSREAARVAARAHPRLASIVADAERTLPIRTARAGVVLVVFAPRQAAELRRIVAPDGLLVVATPGPRHLAELVAPMGLLSVDPQKAERLETKVSPVFERVAHEAIERRLEFTRDDAGLIAAMGPSAFHHTAEELAGRAARLAERIEVTVSFELSTFRPRR